MSLPAPNRIQCSDCLGKRFSDNTLQATYRDQSIAQILNLTVDAALKIFEHQPILASPVYGSSDGGTRLSDTGTNFSNSEWW